MLLLFVAAAAAAAAALRQSFHQESKPKEKEDGEQKNLRRFKRKSDAHYNLAFYIYAESVECVVSADE